MQYEVEVNGRLRHVHIHRMDGQFVVGLEGKEQHIDAVRVDAHTLSLLTGTMSHEVTVAATPVPGQLTVGVGGVPVMVTLNGRRRWGKRDEGGTGASGPQRLAAPMPGKIVRILVQPGDPVQPRQPLVVIEAMKMENELRASRDGIVTDLHVREGQLVDAGALLLVIAPA
jgi:biotin carboxyl carrier protein